MWNLNARIGRAWAAPALALLLGGCAASTPEPSAEQSFLNRTLQRVSSALETGGEAVTTTLRRIVREQREGWEEMRERERREKEAAPAKAGTPTVRPPQPAPADRFPAGRLASSEQNIGSPRPAPPRGQEDGGIAPRPLIPQTPDQIRARLEEIGRLLPQERNPAERQRLAAERERLAQALQASGEEEALIRE
ncbi:MAG: hypothetical protein AABZ64_09395, partial [Nitrospinota bacterium]